MKSCAILVGEEIVFNLNTLMGSIPSIFKIETKIPTYSLIEDEHSMLPQILMHYASSLEKNFQLCPSCLFNLNLKHVIFWKNKSLAIYF